MILESGKQSSISGIAANLLQDLEQVTSPFSASVLLSADRYFLDVSISGSICLKNCEI